MTDLKTLLTKNAKQIFGYAALVMLAYVFIVHGLQALIFNPAFISLVTSIGIPYSIAKWMVFLVGIVDLLVAISLFVYRKRWVVIYAGLWPFVPFVLVYTSVGYIAWQDLLYGPVMAIIVYEAFFGFSKKTSGVESI